jgi:hypothetical protein
MQSQITYIYLSINVRENPEWTISQRHRQHWAQNTERKETKQSAYRGQDTERRQNNPLIGHKT